ncbi:Nucleobindin-2 [Armadillidium nasatum]|uniref:Nucleobindin-2 n=1 Tax=Armadillidium nasatum TaxID=96803 RepID=A0A5N5SS87_9CRUS|nr:Nucleobindin-2 [Armadillidium nasatum]
MKFIKLFLLISLFYVSFGLPVIEKKEDTKTINEADQPKDEDWSLGLEYERYLKEVVQALESDPEFRKKLETADVEDIKSGKIAKDLHLVDHNVRTKLDELKRRELERLRHLAIKEHERKIGVDRSRLKVPVHLDHRNPDRFESEDLSRLIQQVHRDIEKVEKEREEEFKRYELEKEYKYKHDLEGMDEDHKKQAVLEHEETLKKHKDHPKLHHPGSKQQLEEVNLDGNGYWDENEVKTLFQKELDKMYDPNAPEDDMNERYEEMERMRAHVFAESDFNKDNLISFDEFIEQTKKNDFERDEGWQGLDEQQVYSQQEYEEYERQRQMEMQRLVESGAIPPPPGYYGRNHPQPLAMDDHNFAGKGVPPVPVGVVGNPPHPGPQVVYQQVPQGYQQLPQDYHQGPQGYQQVPQGYQQVPQGYQQVPQGYQQMPQGYHQVPQGYQQVPQGHQQVPQGHQQVPQGHQQVPQGYQQVPQGYQQVPQSSYQQVPAQDQKNQKQQPIAAPQSVPQAQAMPQAQAAPQAMPQAQAVPQAQALPQAIPQAQGPPKIQNSQSPQVQGQAQNVQHNQIGSKKDGQNPGETHPEINQHPPGVVLQNQQDHLNQLPEVKPIDNNHL